MSAEIQGPEVGDVVLLFRLGESPEGEWASPILLQDAVLAALRHAGVLPYGTYESPGRDAETLRDFKRRATMQKPQVRRYARSDWNR